MAIRVETPYSLSDWFDIRDDIKLVRSMRGANADRVQMGPGKRVNATKQNLPQLFFLLFIQEGAEISVLIRPTQEY